MNNFMPYTELFPKFEEPMYQTVKKNYRLLLLVPFVLAYILSSSAGAQDKLRVTEALDQLFTIKSIDIDEEAKSSMLARSQGLRKAQNYAYLALMKKIIALADLERLPQLSERQKLALIRGIDYLEEKRSGKRYIARVNIGFEPSKVSELLAAADIPHVLGAGPGVLVLHGHKINGLRYVFEENTIGNQAWDRVDSINRLRSYTTLGTTLKERTSIGYATLASLLNETDKHTEITDAITSLAKENGVEEAAIIKTRYSDFDETVHYSFYLTQSQQKGHGAIHVSEVIQSAETGQTDIPIQQQMIEYAFDRILSEIDDLWRSQLLINSSITGEKTVFLPTQTMTDFITLEKAIKKLSLVYDWRVEEITVPLSKATFKYRGREDQLALALKMVGLSLEPYGDDVMLSPIKAE